MKRKELITQLQDRFGEEIVRLHDKSEHRLYVEVGASDLKKICEYLFHEVQARFNIASGLDMDTHLEILYHFIEEDLNLLISVRVRLDSKEPKIESLATSIPAAEWIEREISELFGITFEGHPDPRRLLLPQDWPEGVHPLRQDYEEWDAGAVRDRGVQ